MNDRLCFHQRAASMDRRTFLRLSLGGAASLGLGMAGVSCVRNHFDTIIRNGVIYTGDGKAPIKGDLAIKDGRIAAIGSNLGDSADHIVDAKGMIVSPGFIDIHTHTDTNLLVAPKGDSRIFQGITTDVCGNCGEAAFPRWEEPDGFFNALEKNGMGINLASFVGEGDVRMAAVGDRNQPATREQIEKECAILRSLLEVGAVGLSYGLEYTPGSYSSDEEIIALNKVVAEYDALYAIHMRNEDDHVEEAVAEAIRYARESGARLEISHLKAQNEANWHRLPKLLAMIDEASKDIDIAFDRYPYTAFSTGFTSFIPLSHRDGSDEDIKARLNDPAACRIIAEYCDSRVKRLGGPQNVLVAGCSNPENSIYSGKNIEECCAISGMDVWPMIRHLLLSENLGVQMAGFAMKESNLEMIYAHRLSMPGSDGSVYSPEGPLSLEIPHPRSYGTFPRFFEKYVREKKVMDMAEAIHKCTQMPAERLHIKERGLLVPSYHADVVIFNPDTIADVATYAQPHTFPTGIEHVFVNGVHAISKGEHTGALAGQVVRRNV